MSRWLVFTCVETLHKCVGRRNIFPYMVPKLLPTLATTAHPLFMSLETGLSVAY
jgi:hypothetical protein